MNLAYAGVVGVFVGAVVGLAALQLRMPPLAQSVAAVLVAVLLSTGMTFFLGDAGGDGFFAFGPDNLVRLSVLMALSAVLHGLLGVFGTALPSLVEHRALVLSCAGGLYSSLSVAIGLNNLSKT
jgi:hypothetical protein